MNTRAPYSFPRAILLDFYGTVVQEDDVPIVEMCSQVAAASPTGSTVAEIGSYWGRVYRQLCEESFGAAFRSQKHVELYSLQRVLDHFEADLDGAALSKVLYDYWARPALCPESKEVLGRCAVPVCLVSNIDNKELQSALAHNGLHFDWVVTSEDCQAYKPRPEMFERALSLLGLPAASVLHVGDSFSSDVRGARSMGIPVLWINRKKRKAPGTGPVPDYVSIDLTGLLDVL